MTGSMSRRGFLRFTAAASAAVVGTAVLAGPHPIAGRGPRAAAAAGTWEAYHGVTAADHQKNFDRLSGQGFRITSLSVYGEPSDPRYAAVWVQEPGSEWVAVHGVNAAAYQDFFNTQTGAGFQPVIISATGPAGSAVFAAVFEKDVTSSYKARHGMTSTDFQNEVKSAGDAQYLRSVAIYGTASDRRYAAVWLANADKRKVHQYWGYSASDYQTVFNAETSLPGYHPSYVALSSDGTYAALFSDRLIGAWVARHGMTAADYQTEFDTQKGLGRRPICVQGGGSGNGIRYAAIWAERDDVSDYSVTVRGDAVPALAGFDTLMQNFMRDNGIRAAQLTLAKDGVVKLAHAYTIAESGSGYRQTETSDRFRLASCSKIFLEAAVQSLYDAGKLKTDTKVYPLLGYSNPKDTRSDDITIQHLLDHQGGYDRAKSGDPTFAMRQIAIDQKLGRAVTKDDVIKYMYGRSLDFTPGSNKPGEHYSNYGYMLAGRVVEHVSGQTFFNYVRSTLLQPLGITEVQMSPTALSARPANEPFYEDEGLGLSALDPSSTTLIPAAYGGAGHILEVADSAAGLAASATALARFIHTHAVWGNGGRALGAREGSDPGANSFAVSRGDGVDWALVFNTRDFPGDLGTLTDAINTKLNTTKL